MVNHSPVDSNTVALAAGFDGSVVGSIRTEKLLHQPCKFSWQIIQLILLAEGRGFV
jgi:hypothetical protein